MIDVIPAELGIPPSCFHCHYCMETPIPMEPAVPKRQCWECTRRRLVCDSSRSGCNKCRAAGMVCPGYGDKKPLKWLEPGKVSSRVRHRKGSSASNHQSRIVTIPRTPDMTKTPGGGTGQAPKMTIFLGELSSEIRAAMEAALYYNSQVYPDFEPMHQLAPNPYIILFAVEQLRFFPASMCHALAYLALSHRTQRLFQSVERSQLMELRSRFYHHQGLAIRALGEDIGNAKTKCSDRIITSVLMVLFSEIRQSPSFEWRHHFSGAAEMIRLRGGLKDFCRSSQPLRPAVLYFLIIGVMTNTTSPPSRHIPATSELGIIDMMADLYGDGLFPVLLCPPYLFLGIIKVNHLRLHSTRAPIDESTQSAALALLEHIGAFAPETWAESNVSARDEWALLGYIYQSAVALYCILSLQSISIFQSTRLLDATRVSHHSRLLQHPQKAVVDPILKKCMTWPLVVAGMGAIDADLKTRHFVDGQLFKMSRDLGTPVPLAARAMFKRFWASGKTNWDDCFDRPYAFVS